MHWGQHTASQPPRAGSSSILCSSPTSCSFAGFSEIPLGFVWVFANTLLPGFSLSPPYFPLPWKGLVLPTSLAGSERDRSEFSVSAGELSALGSARSPRTRGKRSPDYALPAPKLLLAPGPQCSQLENGGKTTKNEQSEGVRRMGQWGKTRGGAKRAARQGCWAPRGRG